MDAWIWVAFVVLVLGLLALDLTVAHRKPHLVGTGEALAWTAFYVALALAFGVFVHQAYEHHWFGIGERIGHDLGGHRAAIEYYTAWLLEKSLSLDNIFVIALIFSFFGVPGELQHRALFWGVLGALVLRGAMIAAGASLLARFEWIAYLFGALLFVTALRMLVTDHEDVQPERNVLVRLFRRALPVTDGFHGSRFLVKEGGRRAMTPLFLALLVVETSDVVFAVDSIPAALAVTKDPFLVYTSNVFAILGLRSLYFALAGLMQRFHYLRYSLVAVLAFVGVKMILSLHHPIPNGASLIVIVSVLAAGALVSTLVQPGGAERLLSPLANEAGALAAFGLRQAKRVIVLVVGSTVVLAGAVMLVTPGPGVVVVFLGFGILAVEFRWARRLLRRTKEAAGAAKTKVQRALGRGGGEGEQ